MGDEDFEHGVSIVGKTIKHPSFTISLAAIELGTFASGYDRAAIRTHCLGHALQWAAEIEAGKQPRDVVPNKIANFLTVSIMSGKVRADVAEVRMAKANPKAAVSPMRAALAALEATP